MQRPDTISESSAALPSSTLIVQPPPLAASASWRLAAMLARTVVGLVAIPLFTRTLGISQWGLLALFQAATAPLMLLDLGLGVAVVKYVSESLARDDRRRAVRIVQTALITNLVMGVAGAMVLILAAHWLATGLFAIPSPDAARAQIGFRIAAITWFFGMQTALLGAVIAAHQRYDVTSKLNTLSVIITTSAGVAAAFVFREAVAVMLAQCAVALGMAIVQYRAVTRFLPGIAVRPRWDLTTFGQVFRFGIWQVAAMIGVMVSGWSDRYLLGVWFAPAVIGFFAAVQVLYTQLFGAFAEMGEVLFPAVSHRKGTGDLPNARRLTLLAGWVLTNGFGVCAVVLAVVGGDFLHLWISPDAARAATTTLRLLCIAGIAGMTALAPFNFMLGIGEIRWNATSAVLVGLSVLGIGLWLVPRFGLLGVGYGLLTGMVARWGFVAVIWRRQFASEYRLAQFAAHVWVPSLMSLLLLWVLTWIHDGLGYAVTWPWFCLETAAVSAIATLFQWASSEVIPGGPERRSQVVASFKAALVGIQGNRTPT